MSRNTCHRSNERPCRTFARQRSFLRWMPTRRMTCAPAAMIALILLAGVVGCGTNLDQLLLTTGSAVGRTYLDLFLTDVANNIADRLDEQATGDEDDDADDDGGDDIDDDGDDGGDSGGDLTDLTGDPAAGETVYASCAGCHCADAVGDCMPGAPGLIGASAEVNDEYLRGDTYHPTKPALSDQEIVDLAAYLASLE